MRTLWCAIGLFAAAACGACERSTSDTDIVWLKPPDALQKMNASAGIFRGATNGVFVDPRSPRQFAEGHIPDAINLPLQDMQDNAHSALRGYDLFVVYDADFMDGLAVAGSKRLMEMGYTNVYTLEGGLRAWKKDGNPVATGTGSDAAAPQRQ